MGVRGPALWRYGLGPDDVADQNSLRSVAAFCRYAFSTPGGTLPASCRAEHRYF